MGRYDGEDYERKIPCKPEDHRWAINGHCWGCDRSRQSLIDEAKRIIELVEQGCFGRHST